MAIAIDPVCGMEVDTATSLLSFEHEGTTYWFCGKGCLLEFKDDPDKYLARGLHARRCEPPDKSQLSGHAGYCRSADRSGTPRRDRPADLVPVRRLEVPDGAAAFVPGQARLGRDPLDRPRNGHRGSALGLSRIDQLRLPATAAGSDDRPRSRSGPTPTMVALIRVAR